MTPTATLDPRQQLAQAQLAHDELAADLKHLSESLLAAEGDLAIARRKGDDAKALTARGAQVASLRAIVEDQRADVAEAAEALVRARHAAARYEAAEAARQASAAAAQHRAEILAATRDLLEALVRPATRIRELAAAWDEAHEGYVAAVVALTRTAAAEAGTEALDRAVILADAQAWAAAREQLRDAGVDLEPLAVHPYGYRWADAYQWQTGHRPATGPHPLMLAVPPEFSVPDWGDLQVSWQLADLGRLVGVVADAVLTGALEAPAKAGKVAA